MESEQETVPKLSNDTKFNELEFVSNLDFKVNAKQFENGTRQSYTYNGRPIESRIWSMKRHHFQ